MSRANMFAHVVESDEDEKSSKRSRGWNIVRWRVDR